MSGEGAARMIVDATGLHVAIVASSWHDEVMSGLIAGAVRTCESSGATIEIIRVAGSFELPIVAQACATTGRYHAIVALGVIIRGGTPHFEFVSDAATQGLNRVALDHGIPVGFGLLTCDTQEQALARAGLVGSIEDKGTEAAEAALSTALVLGHLRTP
jgi:6,7-dimethyl-8-ribityllumazine synthase